MSVSTSGNDTLKHLPVFPSHLVQIKAILGTLPGAASILPVVLQDCLAGLGQSRAFQVGQRAIIVGQGYTDTSLIVD
jgi:hypothetical protein